MADVGKIESYRDSLRVDIKTNTQAYEYNEEECYARIRFPTLDSIRVFSISLEQSLETFKSRTMAA